MQQNNNDNTIIRKCTECFTGKHKCFICKEHTNDVVKCAEKKCGKFYHLDCIVNQNYPHKILNEDQKTFKCPLHFCLTCYNEHLEDSIQRTVKKKLLSCILCPTSYHHLDSCIAAGSISIDSDHIQCPEHQEINKKKKHVNISWCFSCNFGGDLICCEKCPAAKHLNCIIEDEGKPPNDDCYYCIDCVNRKQLHYNDIIWVKLSSFRWWPAQIKHPVNVPDNILRIKHEDADFPVYFFGSHDYYWINKSKAFLYVDGDDKKKMSTHGSGLDKVFQKAMAEVVEAYKKWQESKDKVFQSKTINHTPYFHLKVNKPYGKCQQAFVDMDKSNKQVCDCTDKDPCTSDENCLNRLLMYECDGAICKNSTNCKNQRFKKREYAKTEKFKSTAGWGLRSLEDIKKGQFVIEYVGELIDEEECNKRLRDMAERNDRNFYFLTIDKETIIDAGPKGNLARFMNHSCDPNCETQKWVVNNQVRVGLFAVKDIKSGTELTFNYNLECRGDEKTKCLCNSKNCSGFIGVRPNKIVREKQKEAKKRKVKPKAIHEDECFICGDDGKLMMCDSKNCPRSYHTTCLGLDKIPHGKWICPVHHCDICSKKPFKFCNYCPTSFCTEHQNEVVFTVLANGELICEDHPSEYLNKIKRKASKLAKSADTSSSKIESLESESLIEVSNRSSTKKSKVSNINQQKEELEELRKQEQERKRKNTELRESRFKRRKSNLETQSSTSSTTSSSIKKLKTNHNKELEGDKNLNNELDVEMDIDKLNNNSLETNDINLNNNELIDKINDNLNELTKDKIVEDKLTNGHISTKKDDNFKDVNDNNLNSNNKIIKDKKTEVNSQKENLDSEELDQINSVDKILNDEIIFNNESNETYLSAPKTTNSQQNGKIVIEDNLSQLNGTIKLNNNNENENHNHKLKSASSTNNELTDTLN